MGKIKSSVHIVAGLQNTIKKYFYGLGISTEVVIDAHLEIKKASIRVLVLFSKAISSNVEQHESWIRKEIGAKTQHNHKIEVEFMTKDVFQEKFNDNIFYYFE